MATFTKKKLSASTDGKPILIAATATPGTLIHTAVAGTTDFDEIWVWLSNTSLSDAIVTIEYGDATAPGSNVKYTVLAQDGLKCVLPGTLLQNGATLRIFCGTASVVNAIGHVHLIAP
jgi:hypothetical protein